MNLPEDAAVEEVEEVYYQGWKLGLKALAIYRDNCKVGQPLSDGKKADDKKATASGSGTTPASDHAVPVRRRLPKTRPSLTTSFTVAGAQGYLTAGLYPDNGLGEIFLRLGKQGSTLAGVMDAFSIAVSIGLQYGVPLTTYVEKLTNLRFEPAGMTDDQDIRMAQSIMDYIFRRLALDHLPYKRGQRWGSSPRRHFPPQEMFRKGSTPWRPSLCDQQRNRQRWRHQRQHWQPSIPPQNSSKRSKE